MTVVGDRPGDTRDLTSARRTLAMRIHQSAEWIRSMFDRVPRKLGAVTLVGFLAGVTAITGQQQMALLERAPVGTGPVAVNPCSPLPVSVARIEVTFSARLFGAFLSAEGSCRENVVTSLIGWDQLFPVAYGLLLCAAFMWTERWRRFTPQGIPIDHEPSIRRDLLILAPLAAAALDMVIENVPLFVAAKLVDNDPSSAPSLLTTALVLVGSTGAVLKWVLLLIAVAGIAAELLAGPRSAVLWRVRFSAFAVLFGGVPLLVIPQGQDIVQRLFEGQHPVWRLWSAVLPVVFAALAVWYSARKLTELRFRSAAPANTHGWYAFFSEHVPRLFGILVLTLAALAFAKAAEATVRFFVVAAVDLIGALLARRFFPRRFGQIGRVFLPRGWRRAEGLDERVGRLVLAAVIGLFLVWPFSRGETISVFGLTDAANEQTALLLRVAAYLCVVAGWIFQLFVRFRRHVRHAVRNDALMHPEVNTIDAHNITPELQRAIIAGTTLSVAWFILATWMPVTVGRLLGPLSILSIVTVNAVFVGSVFVWLGTRHRLPLITSAIVLALLFSQWNDNHQVRVSEPQDAGHLQRPSVNEHFNHWRSALPDGTKHPVVLVAAAGGGLRAAYWTAMSLAVIADNVKGFDRHVFAISGISGGSLGGALFAALSRDGSPDGLRCAAAPNDSARPMVISGPYARCVRLFMSDDHLSPVLAKLLAPDLAQWLLPFPVYSFDRSIALEESWERSYQQTMNRDTFAQGFARFTDDPAVRARLPLLLLNSTHVETGRRYITTTAVRDGDLSRHDFQNASDTLDVLQRDVPLSTAVHNSARFTYVSPAGHLNRDDGREYGRLVDGGYFENSGLATLREIYDLLTRAADVLPIERLWVNPDCGLKTRGWPEVEKALANMVSAAHRMRRERDKAMM